jgi:hypothetical protein
MLVRRSRSAAVSSSGGFSLEDLGLVESTFLCLGLLLLRQDKISICLIQLGDERRYLSPDLLLTKRVVL